MDGPAVERIDPDKIAAERRALEQWLDCQRQTLLIKCAGLTAEQLRQRSVTPSALSLLGLVRHLADVERGWLRQCAAREDVPDLYYTKADPQEIVAARAAAVADMSLDDVVPFAWGGPDRDLRWIFLHMIEEYARHNGHADLIREAVDGQTGE